MTTRKEIAERVQTLGELQEVLAARLLETLQIVETQVLSDSHGTNAAKYAKAALDCQIDAMLNMVRIQTTWVSSRLCTMKVDEQPSGTSRLTGVD